jgi:peptidoglycan/xylan/chitin deacetylase (PgdA/CDA1 family)
MNGVTMKRHRRKRKNKNNVVILLAVCFALICLFVCAYTYKEKNADSNDATVRQTGDGSTSSDASDSAESEQSSTEITQGWMTENGASYYYQDGVRLTKDWLTLDGKTYYFDKDGKMCTGAVKINKKSYRFAETGEMITGWYPSSSDKQCYYNKKGQLQTNKSVVIGKIVYSFGQDGEIRHQADTTKPMIALTYDDGPSKNTSTIVETLKKYDSVATFFVVAERISYFPDSFKSAYENGNEIASHTYAHTMLNKLSASEIKEEIDKANKEIKKYIGIPAALLRPPGGNISDTVRETVDSPMILWSVDTEDWSNRNTATTTSRALANPEDGDIILMHDLYETTAAAADKIASSLINDGFQLVTVSELIAARGGAENGKAYFSFAP